MAGSNHDLRIRIIADAKQASAQVNEFAQQMSRLTAVQQQLEPHTRAAMSAEKLRTEAMRSSATTSNMLTGSLEQNFFATETFKNSLLTSTVAVKADIIATKADVAAKKQLTDVSGTASYAVLSLGQGLQDAGQFGMGMAQGIRAVTNNVQQAVTAFTILAGKMEKGESAFKAFKTALIGPAGWLLAFGAVSALVEGLSNYFQRANKGAREAKNAFKELFSVMAPGSNILLTSSSAALALSLAYEELGLAQQEIVNQQAHVATAIGSPGGVGDMWGAVTVVMNDASDAAEEARKMYEGMAADLSDVTDTASAAEVAFAAVLAVLDANKIRTLELTAANRKLLDEYNRGELILDERNLQLREEGELFEHLIALQKVKLSIERSKRDIESGAVASEAQANLRLETQKLVEENVALDAQLALLETSYGVYVAGVERANAEIKRETDWRKFLNAQTEAQAWLMMDLVNAGVELEYQSLSLLRVDKDGNIVMATKIELINDLAEAMKKLPHPYMDGAAAAKAWRDEFNQSVDDAQRIRDAMAEIGADLIVSLAAIGGGMDGFLRSIGQFLSRYGEEMIKMGLATMLLGVSVEAVKEALKSFQGAKAIVAGALLVAAGAALKNQSRSSHSRLTGRGGGASIGNSPGSTYDPKFYNVNGRAAPSVFAPSIATGSRIDHQFVVKGRDLVTVVNEENMAKLRTVG